MLLINNSEANIEFCTKVLNLLNAESVYKNTNTEYTPRVVGDLVQLSVSEHIEEFGYKKTDTVITKRSMADIEIYDGDDTIVIDVKTHFCGANFSMPNLCSIKRLYDLYKSKNKYFAILFVDYELVGNLPVFTKVWFLPIENIDWKCLSIGNLGIGQIQIKNAKKIEFNFEQTREEWIATMKDKINTFFEKQMRSIQKRQKYFSEN